MEEFTMKIADERDVGIRIDKYLAAIMEGKSRSFIQGLIDSNSIFVNGKEIKSNYKLRLNDEITGVIEEPIEFEAKPEKIDLDIIYEDKDLLIVNKPQGMVVHPAPGNYSGTLVNGLLFHCKALSTINGETRPGIVHRIDKDTSGILVVAKNNETHMSLAAQFKEHSIKREYYALVEGKFSDIEGTIDKSLGRNKKDRLKMGIVEEGKRAVTHYKVLEQYNHNLSLIRCSLETGRTHQIRVHMKKIGHPIVGDTIYGYKKQKFNLEGQLLHAQELGFIHPTTGDYVNFTSELPNYFTKIINLLQCH